MKGYIVLTHIGEGSVRKPLRAFVLLAQNHQEAVERVRQVDSQGAIDVEAVLHLRAETAERLKLGTTDVWQL